MAEFDKRVCVPVDPSPHSKRALEWALLNMVGPNDKLSLLCVQNALSDHFAAEAVSTPFSDAVQIPEGYTHTQRHPDAQQACDQTLQDFKQSAMQAGVRESQLRTVQVEPAGGASGVGESIVQYVQQSGQDVVVMGSRGMGAIRRTMLSMLGLGSVSEFAVNHVHTPVVVVKPPLAADAAPSATKKASSAAAAAGGARAS